MMRRCAMMFLSLALFFGVRGDSGTSYRVVQDDLFPVPGTTSLANTGEIIAMYVESKVKVYSFREQYVDPTTTTAVPTTASPTTTTTLSATTTSTLSATTTTTSAPTTTTTTSSAATTTTTSTPITTSTSSATTTTSGGRRRLNSNETTTTTETPTENSTTTTTETPTTTSTETPTTATPTTTTTTTPTTTTTETTTTTTSTHQHNFNFTQLGDDGIAYEPTSMAISSDGHVLALAKYTDNEVQVYELLGSTWSLTGTVAKDTQTLHDDDHTGYSISLSKDGTRLVVGSPLASGDGLVRVFSIENNTLTQMGSDIRGGSNRQNIGYSVAISGDGNTIAIGSEFSDPGHPFVRVHTYDSLADNFDSITANLDTDGIGGRIAVALNHDASVLAVGNALYTNSQGFQGRVAMYVKSASQYVESKVLVGQVAGTEEFAKKVTLSEDGTRVMIVSDSSLDGPVKATVYEYNTNDWYLSSVLNSIGHASASRDVMTLVLTSSPSQGGDLKIATLMCNEDYHVQSHMCVPCEWYEENSAGDDPREQDTTCDLAPTTTTTTAAPTTTTTLAPTTTTLATTTTTATLAPTTTTETPTTTLAPEEENSDEMLTLIAMAGGGGVGFIVLVILCVMLCRWRGRKQEIVRIQRDLTIDDSPTARTDSDDIDPSGMFDL